MIKKPALIIALLLYGSRVYAQVPIAAYSFNEGTGTVAGDSSANANNGNLSGATWNTQGKFGNCLSFNGTGARVIVNNSASLQLTTGMTLEAWVRPTVVSSVYRGVIYKHSDNYYLEGTSPSNGAPLTGGTFSGEISAPSALPVNTWSHIAATYDKTTLRLYVNGIQVASKSATANITTSTNPLQIGGDNNFGNYFSGLIDEVRIYNRALTQAEISTDMNTPIGTILPPQVSPIISNGTPTGTLPATTTQITLGVSTNVNSTCKYATTAGLTYSAMPSSFSVTGGVSHNSNISGIQPGTSYNYFVKCSAGGVANTVDYPISFSVAAVIPPPIPVIVSYDKNPDAPVQIQWDYDINFQSQINGFSLYASDASTGPWILYNGIPNPTARTFSFISPDKDTYFTLDACKQTSPTGGTCSVKSNVIKIHCIPLTETYLWATYITRICR